MQEWTCPAWTLPDQLPTPAHAIQAEFPDQLNRRPPNAHFVGKRMHGPSNSAFSWQALTAAAPPAQSTQCSRIACLGVRRFHCHFFGFVAQFCGTQFVRFVRDMKPLSTKSSSNEKQSVLQQTRGIENVNVPPLQSPATRMFQRCSRLRVADVIFFELTSI